MATSLSRQNTLFVAEDWTRIYESLENVDFRAYDFENLTDAMLSYLRENYPEEFNDWIASSEFISKIELIAWLSQIISFRVDLNTRENFLSTAERRNSVLQLASNISYKPNRVRSATGKVKIISIRTNQQIVDSNNINLQDTTIIWNDPRNEDWFEQFTLIMNRAFTNRTPFGRPLNQYTSGDIRIDQHAFNSISPISGSYQFSASVNGITLPFDLHNAKLNTNTGQLEEIAPGNDNVFNTFFFQDGLGFASTGTGFFFPIKQGHISFRDQNFSQPRILNSYDVAIQNINNDDFFVQQLDTDNNVIETWTKVNTIFGEGTSFNTLPNVSRNIYELSTLENDQVRVLFADGNFGNIPVGTFRFWFRTSNRNALLIKASSIQNEQITIPYVYDQTLYFLTIGFSLQETLTNAASSETDSDIRNRAGRVYYTQNRMVTARDYNSFFLQDNSIRKIKTVNRTFTGHSRYAKLHDPTSLYQNVKTFAEDGRFYKSDTLNTKTVSADILRIPIDKLINNHIKPILLQPDKRLLYYNRYPEIYFTNDYKFMETSNINGQSRGNITTLNNIPQRVGNFPDITNNLHHLNSDAVIRYNSLRGPIASVDRIINDGTTPDSVIFHETIPSESTLISIFPAFRDRFTSEETIAIEESIEAKTNFALSWKQTTETWDIITYDNINIDGEFSLKNQGDTSSSCLDASWLIFLEFIPGGIEEDSWKIVDRGLGLFFESAREVDFIFANDEPTINPETGQMVIDNINILNCNESRDSLRRRGINSVENSHCELNTYSFIGDGETTCFKTQEIPLTNTKTIVTINNLIQSFSSDYNFNHSVEGDSVCFSNAPQSGASITIRISNTLRNSVISKVTVSNLDGINDSNNEFDLKKGIVIPQNVLSFIEGILQTPSTNFSIGTFEDSASIIFNNNLDDGEIAVQQIISGIDSVILTRSNFISDGTTNIYNLPTRNQTKQTVLIFFDGRIQNPNDYNISSNANAIMLNSSPPEGTKIHIISHTTPELTRGNVYSFEGDGVTTSFSLTDLRNIQDDQVLVWINGILLNSSDTTWEITGNNSLVFINNAPPNESSIIVWVLQSAIGTLSTAVNNIDTTANNLGNINTNSCIVHYLGEDVSLSVVDVIHHNSGHINKNGLFVIPEDKDRSGFYDNPFLFRDIVLQDGFTDLVLWNRIEEDGFSIWNPINQKTVPKGTYGLQSLGYPSNNDTYNISSYQGGDIHYDLTTNTWLIANSLTGKWSVAEIQDAYRHEIGRDHLRFSWTHYASIANRIDPSVSNIMDTFILTSAYDDEYRTWLLNDGEDSDKPIAPTPESLRVQYSNLEEFKMQSDSIIYYTSEYIPLFGRQAIPSLQATFKIVQTPGSSISDNDLKLRVLDAINEYFDVDRWEFGDTFFFTELAAYIHVSLAPNVQSVIIVPKSANQTFGRLFQIKAESNQLFISAASPDDIQVVSSLTDDELRIGTLSV